MTWIGVEAYILGVIPRDVTLVLGIGDALDAVVVADNEGAKTALFDPLNAASFKFGTRKSFRHMWTEALDQVWTIWWSIHGNPIYVKDEQSYSIYYNL